MNYSEILASLGLLVEEYSSNTDLKEIFDEPFIKSFEESYNKAQLKSNELVQATHNYLDNNTNLILTYNRDINRLEKKYINNVSLLQDKYEDKKKSYLKQIKDSNNKYSKLSNDIQVSVVKKNNITQNSKLSREIEFDNKNEIIKSKEKPNLDKYNYYIGIFNNTADLKYNKFHSSLSKSQYDLVDSSKNYQKHLEEIDHDISSKIENYKNTIIDEEKKLNDEIKQIETALNKKISEIQLMYNTLIKQNSEQYKVEVNSCNVDIEKIEELYKKDVQNINLQARKKLVEVDKKYNAKEHELKQKLQDKKYLNRVKTTLNNSKLEQTKELIKNKNISHSDKVSLKSKYKFELHKYQFEQRTREKEIENLEQELENLSNEIKKEKKEIEAWRQYNINLKTIDKDVKIKPLEESIESKTREKNLFDSIQRNNQAKEINNEKRNVNILILRKKKDYDSYYAKVQIEINKLQIEHLKNIKNQEVSSSTENEIIKFNQNYDLISEKYFFNQSLYNIEKNKYLLDYNNILINYYIEKNALEKNERDVIDNIELERYSKIAKETIDFNNNSAIFYENILKNFIDTCEIHLKNDIASIDIEKNNKIANYKYNLQYNRSRYDLRLLRCHINYFDYLIKTFLPLFLVQLNKVIQTSKNSLDSCSIYFSSVCSLIVKFIKEFFTIETRILNDHIKLDAEIKYSSIYTNANYEYHQKLNAYNSQIDNYNNTNNNYKNTINEFYRRINELNYKQNKLLSNSNDSHIRNELQDIKKKIAEYQSKNRQNREKIDNFESKINAINERKKTLESHFLKKIRLIKRKEIIDSEDSNNTIEKFKVICEYYINLINNMNKKDFIENLLTYKKTNTRFNKFNKAINKKSSKMIFSLCEIVNIYNDNLKNSLDKIKSSNFNAYLKNRTIANKLLLKDLSASNHEYIRLKHQFNDNVTFHKNNLFSINKSCNFLLSKEKNAYKLEEGSLNDDFDENHNKYFLRFKSCDELIRYSTNNYKNSVKHYTNIQHSSIKNHAKSADLSFINESKVFEQVIEKFKNEIIMIPRLMTNQIYETNVLTNEKNKELDNITKELNESTKKYKEQNLLNISNYLDQKQLEKDNEKKKYRNTVKDIRLGFAKKDKATKKNIHKE